MPPRTSPSRTKAMPCRVCGNPVMVSPYRRKPVRCVTCGVMAAAEAARQMHARSGPLYDKWYAARWPGKSQESRTTPNDKDSLIPTGQDVLLASSGAMMSHTGVGRQASRTPCRADDSWPGATVERERSTPHARSRNT